MYDPHSRQAKIEGLFRDLQEEIMAGILNGEIDEGLSHSFIVPYSKNIKPGVVVCSFEMKPMNDPMAPELAPRLRLVHGEKNA